MTQNTPTATQAAGGHADAPSHDGIHMALIAAQKAMGPVLKDAKANYGKYATLGNVIETITSPLHDNGIVWFQAVEVMENGEVILVTKLVHAETGQEVASRYPVRCKDHQDPQKVGGAVTYARRYSLLALLGLAPEDDDGNHASQPPKAPQRPQSSPTPPSHARSAPAGSGNGAPPAGESERIAWRERCEAVATAADYAALVDTAERDEWRWVALVSAAPSIASARKRQQDAEQHGMQTPAVVAAADRRAKELAERAARFRD